MGNIEQVFNFKVKLKILRDGFIVNGLRYKTCMKIGPNACKIKNIGFVPVTIRVTFLKKCWVFDLTLARSNIEHPLIIADSN